jgi:predicted short-subunit dehydrogenase-like oxidoreductase (DUF2520 family)
MKVVLVGTGNVATVLGKLIVQQGHTIVGVKGRAILATQILANTLSAEAITTSTTPHADLYIIAVNDSAIATAAAMLEVPTHAKLVHTAASVGYDVLQPYAAQVGVLYPLQSLRSQMPYIPQIPFLVDAPDNIIGEQIFAFASSLSTQVAYANTKTRTQLHVGAVVVSNFVNHLYHLAYEYCDKANLPWDMLQPLIHETADRLQLLPPSQLQTGPAIRKDFVTIEKHHALLAAHPQLQALYQQISSSIIHTFR